MSFKNLIGSFTAIALLLASIGNAIACTTLVVTDVNGNVYHGRTLEFSDLIDTSLTYFPAATRIQTTTPEGKQGVTFNTKYPILGMSLSYFSNEKQPSFLQGMNDQGLSFTANALTNSSAGPIGSDGTKILSAADLASWMLGNYRTTDEVKAAVTSGEVQFWLPKTSVLGNIPLPLHYAIFDKTGGSIVIEFTHGNANVYDNPVGVLTNGPEFPWHLTNLNNYTFDNVNKNSGQLGKLKLQTADAGIALTALPSAQTATGRFVKAAFYANYVRKGKNPDDAINTLSHIMNNFDRPRDLSVDPPGGMGDGPRGNALSSEITTWTTMTDLSRNLFFTRSINGFNWAVIDLNKLKSVTAIKTISTYDVEKSGADVFTLFLK
jgi:choloylglycine hydrolase